MRARAEKRRLLKQGGMELAISDQATAQESVQLTSELLEGREYECVAAQARKMNDLVELLQDAQTRLRRVAVAARINSVRQSQIAEYESSL
jgi:hypothetical protein